MHKLSNYYKKKFGQQSDKLMQTPIGSVMSNSNLGKKDPSGTTATDVKTGNGLSGGVSITSSINTRLFMNSLQDVEKFSNPVDVPVNHTDLSLILRKRLERINHEMDDFTLIVCNFSLAVDYELEKFVKDMAEL